MTLKTTKLRDAVALTLAAGATAFAGTGSAFAQSGQEATTLDRIQVTGSRIRSADVETQAPLLVISRDEIQKQGFTSVADVLQQISTNGAAINTQFNNGGDGSSGVDLRGLGSSRTLVLVNGRRWVSSLDGTVDLNTIPTAVIERIEVLKDGASAIYGSDAIAGVVNLITRQDFDGAEARVKFGQFSQGDGQEEAYDMTLGVSNDRSNLVLGASYVKSDAVSAGDRAISRDPVFGRGAAGYSAFSARGQVWFPDDSDDRLVVRDGADGRNLANYAPFNAATDAYNFAADNFLRTPQERTSLYVQGRFDITDSVSFVTDMLYNERKSQQLLAGFPLSGGPLFFGGQGISGESYYNPYAVQNGGPGIEVDFSRRLVEQAREYRQNVKTYHFFGGLDGSFEVGDRFFDWDVGYSYNRNNQNDQQIGDVNIANLDQGIGPSFLDPVSGQVVCGTPGAIIAGCVPVNLLSSPGGVTDEMLSYILFTAQDSFEHETISYTANLSGSLFELPAGPLGFAVGLERREESGRDTPDAFVAAGLTSGNGRQPTQGSYKLDEVYAEFLIPVLADVPFFNQLEFSLASRYSDYSNFGDTTNSKIGFKWKPVEDLLIRGNYAEGFRAPTISNLFGGAADSFVQFGDPCSADAPQFAQAAARCAAAGVPAGYVQVTNQGNGYFGQTIDPFSLVANPDLGPESATTRTLGFVYSPSFFDGFNMSVDYYDIQIENGISRPTATFVLDQCFVEGDAGYCQLVSDRVVRNASGRITDFDLGLLNLAQINVEAYDVTMSYRTPETRFGNFRITSDSSYISKYESRATPDGEFDNSVGLYTQSAPTWRLRSNLSTDWSLGDFGFTWGARYRSSLVESCAFTGAVAQQLCSDPDRRIDTGAAPRNRIASVTYHDVQARYTAPWNATIAIGANNVFDRDPPIAYRAFANSFDPQYDTPGTFLYMQYTQRF